MDELRRVSTALLGSVDIIKEPADTEADFRSVIEQSMSRGIEVSMELRTPAHAKVTAFQLHRSQVGRNPRRFPARSGLFRFHVTSMCPLLSNGLGLHLIGEVTHEVQCRPTGLQAPAPDQQVDSVRPSARCLDGGFKAPRWASINGLTSAPARSRSGSLSKRRVRPSRTWSTGSFSHRATIRRPLGVTASIVRSGPRACRVERSEMSPCLMSFLMD